MKMFEMLDKLYEKNKIEESPVNIPKKCEEKYTDVKEYKRQYYLKNYLIYKERNRLYREFKKLEKREANRNDHDDHDN
jgi:hypothetical protein